MTSVSRLARRRVFLGSPNARSMHAGRGHDSVHPHVGERSYRFLRLSDVTDYKRRRDEATSKALDEMRSIADEDGAYDIDYFGLPVPVR